MSAIISRSTLRRVGVPFIAWRSTVMALSLLLLALLPHWGAASLGYIGATALGLIVKPAFTVYSQESVPPRFRALMSGATTMAAGVSTSAMALGGGWDCGMFSSSVRRVCGYPKSDSRYPIYDRLMTNDY